MLSNVKVFFSAAFFLAGSQAAENIMITDVPDYNWHAGCFGSASGNMMGFWDRNGFPNFYTGPTNDGLAPLNTNGDVNAGVRSMWASSAGFDGRPADQRGHLEDYWEFYEHEFSSSLASGAPDPHLPGPEHPPDCISDFTGASQNKWTNLDGECNGNIDGYAFNFWDKSGARRHNFTPPDQNGIPVKDLQSGLRAWAAWRGTTAEVFSQLVDFNPETPPGTGFTFEDLKAEINAGYPVMMFLQNPFNYAQDRVGLAHANPVVHGMLAFGYLVRNDGTRLVRYRTSWGSGPSIFSFWSPNSMQAGLALRGVILFRPSPRITSIERNASGIQIKWEGPAAKTQDSSNVPDFSGPISPAHFYQIEKSTNVASGIFFPLSDVSTNQQAVLPPDEGNAFYRVKLLNRAQLPSVQ